jgi:hypothetical protein
MFASNQRQANAQNQIPFKSPEMLNQRTPLPLRFS